MLLLKYDLVAYDRGRVEFFYGNGALEERLVFRIVGRWGLRKSASHIHKICELISVVLSCKVFSGFFGKAQDRDHQANRMRHDV